MQTIWVPFSSAQLSAVELTKEIVRPDMRQNVRNVIKKQQST